MSPSDFESAARAVLPDHVARYFAASARAGEGPDEGRQAWSRIRFRPRVLRNLSSLEIGTTALGTEITMPIMIAPMAQQIAANPEAERAMARAALAAGTLLGVSTNTAVPFSEIGQVGAPWWYQVYITRSRQLTELLVGRAVAAGAKALILTVDAGFFSVTNAAVDPRKWPEGPQKARMTNITAAEIEAAGPDATRTAIDVTFDHIGWLKELSGLPVLVKGVIRADDAQSAVAAGAAGVVVSTHGGRRMGASVTSAEALPEVAAAIGDRALVFVDSGIRHGSDVAAAMALGADGVFIGRPALWALAAGGEPAVTALLEEFRTEFATALAELGVASLSDLTGDLIAHPGARGSRT